MPALVTGIHVLFPWQPGKAWMAGTGPAMTNPAMNILLTPARIGPAEIKNRIVMPAMRADFSPGAQPVSTPKPEGAEHREAR